MSRLNAKADVYTETQAGELTKVCFSSLYQEMVSTTTCELELQVYIGKSKHLPVRLIVELMPEEVYRKRLQKVNSYNKVNGHKTGKGIKNRMRFNLFIANIPVDTMPAESIGVLYKIRWQIELGFKCWKSHVGIDKLQKMKYERFTALLYAKLLLIILSNEIVSNVRCKLYGARSRLLSMVKSAKTMRKLTLFNQEDNF